MGTVRTHTSGRGRRPNFPVVTRGMGAVSQPVPLSTPLARGLSGWPRARRAATRRRGRHRRRHDPCTPGAGRSFGCETVDLSQSGELPEIIEQITGDPWSTRRSTRSTSKPEARARCGGGAGNRPQRHHGRRPCRRVAGHPRPVRHRRPGRDRRKRPDRPDRRPPRSGLGQVAFIHHRPVPSQTVQPPPDEPDSERQGADREGGQCHTDRLGPGSRGVSGFRRRSRQEIRSRPAREHFRLASRTPDQKEYT